MDSQTVLETGPLKIVPGHYPSQIVLRKMKDKVFATHMKVTPPDADPYFIIGRYFSVLEEAKADFRRRCLELDGLQARDEDA